jgi:molecular chaperone GrpE
MSEEEKKEEKIEETQEAGETASPLPDAATDEPPVATDGETEPAAEEPAAEGAAEESPAGQEGGDSAPAVPDWKDMYARMRADFENFRKRTERDRADLAKFAAADVLKDVLATVDNLARALDGAKDKKDDPFVSGVQLVYDGLLKTLADHGATPLDSMGEPFDANYHEALATLPSPDVPEGNVMTEVKRGWLLNGRLLRAAQVVVSAGKAEG